MDIINTRLSTSRWPHDLTFKRRACRFRKCRPPTRSRIAWAASRSFAYTWREMNASLESIHLSLPIDVYRRHLAALETDAPAVYAAYRRRLAGQAVADIARDMGLSPSAPSAN